MLKLFFSIKNREFFFKLGLFFCWIVYFLKFCFLRVGDKDNMISGIK